MTNELSEIPETSAATPATAEAPTILVVDNDRNGGKFVREVLSNAGYRTLLASNGKEALALVQTESIELLITDLIMPNMNGPELAREISQLFPAVKLIFTSGFTEAAAVRFGYMPKAPFLEKPVSSGALRKMVAGVLG